jgi:hypothetical protein
VAIASANYFDQDPDPRVKKDLEFRLGVIKDYFSNDKSISLDNLTMTYDDELWQDVIILVRSRGEEIIKDVLKLSIKVF